jgi:predicted  nucleic acid-binding Zn-ribbon protein
MENLNERLNKFEIERKELRKNLKKWKELLFPLQRRLLQVWKNIQNIKTKMKRHKAK